MTQKQFVREILIDRAMLARAHDPAAFRANVEFLAEVGVRQALVDAGCDPRSALTCVRHDDPADPCLRVEIASGFLEVAGE